MMARDGGSTTGEGNRMMISQLKINFFFTKHEWQRECDSLDIFN